jgi:glycosidase
MDISKLRSSEHLTFNKPNNPPISFKGHEVENGKFKFFVPAKQSSAGQVNVVREDGSKDSAKLQYRNGYLVAEMDMKSPSERVAYNFTVDGKTQVDLTEQKKIGNEDFALTRNPVIPVYKKPHNIYHLLPDSFNASDSKTMDKTGNFTWRNHFDLYGGNIDGIIEKLDYIKSLGAGRVMGTPVFGKDTISNHGYWTENPYQIASRMGNTRKFDELNVELFKRGMAWIADGAFVNQGIKGVQFQDVLRRAANGDNNSPFKDWFTFYGEPGTDFVMGVLPNDENENIDFKAFEIDFENAPYNRDGEPQQYDNTKPTYLVVSDPRTHQERQKDGVHISTESIQQYKFPVNPQEVEEVFEMWGKPDKEMLLDRWSNFSLDTSLFDTQKLLWNGNRDVLKMNMQNPDVREYIFKAGDFWTMRADNAILDYVAKTINQKLNDTKAFEASDDGNLTPEKIHTAIKQLEKEGKLPQGSSEMSVAEITKAIQDSKIAKIQGQTTLFEAIDNYPIEAVELPTEVTGILSNPKFKEAIDKKARKELSQLVENILKSNKLSESASQKLNDPEVVRLISQDVAKAVMVKAISGVDHWPAKDEVESNPWRETIADATLKALPTAIFNSNADIAVDLMVEHLKEGLKQVNTDDIAQKISDSTKDLNVPSVRVAKALANKMEAGLDWRIDAAKDVADLDAVKNNRLDKEKAMKFVSDFWKEFSTRVRDINPNSYIIGEVTDVGDEELKNFIEQDGQPIFSTLSNYRYMWGQPYRFVHAHPEPQYGWNYGPEGFYDDMEQFLKALPISAVNTSHNMVDNHDKALVLHNLLMHPGDFVNYKEDKGPAYTMHAVMREALKEVEKQLDASTVKALEKAIDATAKEAGEPFGFWPVHRIAGAVQQKAETQSKVSPAKISEGLSKMSKVLFDRITDKYLRMLYLQVGVPGAPEIYNGTDLGMTGGESNLVNNKYIQNRNPMPWVWLEGKDAKPEVKAFNDKVKQIFSMRQNPVLQVLNDGFVKDLGVKDDEKGILAFLRYNDRQQAIVILNNGKVDPGSNADSYKKDKPEGNLVVTEPVAKNYKLDLTASGIDKKAVFVDAATKERYIVSDSGQLVKESDSSKGIDIAQGAILYREGNAAPAKPEKIAFKGLKQFSRIV